MTGSPRAPGTTPSGTTPPGGVQVDAVVSAVRPEGGYDVVSLAVPSHPHWDRARPGQLLVVPGDPSRGEVLPRVLWLAGVQTDPLHGTTIQVVLPEGDPLVLPGGGTLRLLGPLGRGLALPTQPVGVVVVAHEEAAAPLAWLVALLRERGCAVHVLLPADDPDRRLDVGPLRRAAAGVVLTQTGELTHALDSLLVSADPALVLATGPMRVVRLVASRAQGRVVRVCAVDPSAPVVCGTGLCGACDLVVHDGAVPRVVRACLEGPVVPGEWLAQPGTEAAGATG